MAAITKNGITLSTDRGSGDATITVTATPNTSSLPRTVRFRVSGGGIEKIITITQQPQMIHEIPGGGMEMT